MRTDETICLNSKVNGKQPYIEDRVFFGGVALVSPQPSPLTDAGCFTKKIHLIRYPHGFFDGGVWENDYCPTITTSAWEFNNYVLEVQEHNDSHKGEE